MSARFAKEEENRSGPSLLQPEPKKDCNEPIVISGMSGRFPESANIAEFRDNLFGGVDLVTDNERRWPSGFLGVPKRSGTIKDLASFDASFFGVSGKQAENMDPQFRIALESTFETILDAGYNPAELRGTRTGVYVGLTTAETEDYYSSRTDVEDSSPLFGCSRALLANRLSFTFNFNGPSLKIDTACSSSLIALTHAVLAIRAGECDAAIIVGTNLLLKPMMTLQFQVANMLSPNGTCKSFDASGDGYVRSEAIGTIFLQKESAARRVYATILAAKTNTDGFKDMGFAYPNGNMQKQLMKGVYDEIGIDPREVAYIEAHGTGTQAGDPEELNSIADFFCNERVSPLLIGSVKSNMGHSEAASGICGLVKVLLAMEAGVIPANLHFKQPNPDAPALLDGRLQVVDKNMAWNGGLVGVNSYGIGGANAHILLKSNPKPKPNLGRMDLPCLVPISGRTVEAVESFIEKLAKEPTDEEQAVLLREIHKDAIVGHGVRGFYLRDSGDQIIQDTEVVSSEKRPIWFVMSGMGSQFPGMGKDMMRLPVFAKSIKRSAEVLQAEGFDLMNLLMTDDKSAYDNVLHSIVAIIAIEIALIDELTALGIHPDGFLGHSVGEVVCAYADGTLTAEQTVLVAYGRGMSIMETKREKGAMASVGLTWEEAVARCPEGVYPACHNSTDNVTVSGLDKAVSDFVEKLTTEGVFARKVESSDTAFHTNYIAEARTKFKAKLDKLIPNPKPRTSRWISTSVPKDKWDTLLGRYSSPEYHSNNVTSPVLLKSACNEVPRDAIIIEVAPHCLLQSILRKNVPAGTITGLMKKGVPDNLIFNLTSIGKLYNAGLQPNISALYPSTTYPVPRGTGLISPLVEWDHSSPWRVVNYNDFTGKGAGESSVVVDLSDPKYEYLAGHKISGRILFPAAGYMVFVWKAFAEMSGQPWTEFAVVFDDIRFERATIMPKEGPVTLKINIIGGTGDFVVSNGNSVAVRGRISTPEDDDNEIIGLSEMLITKTEEIYIEQDEIYKYLKPKGFDYSGSFRGLLKIDQRVTTGRLVREDDLICFMDAMLQFAVFGLPHIVSRVPIRIRKVVVNPVKHREFVANYTAEEGVPIVRDQDIDVTASGGIEVRGIKWSVRPVKPQKEAPTLEHYNFVPYENLKPASITSALTVLLQIVFENSGGAIKIKVVELSDVKSEENIWTKLIVKILETEPLLCVAATVVNKELQLTPWFEENGITLKSENPLTAVGDESAFLAVGSPNFATNLSTWIHHGGFILINDPQYSHASQYEKNGLSLVGVQRTTDSTLLLLRKVPDYEPPKAIVRISEDNYDWVVELKSALAAGGKFLMLCEGETTGALGLATCLRREDGGANMRLLWLKDSKSTPYTPSGIYEEQLRKDLVTNVFQSGQVGSYRHFNLENGKECRRQVQQAFVNILSRGDLSSLCWIEGPQLKPMNSSQVFCHVYYAPLNFRDVMHAISKLPEEALPASLHGQDCILGLEFCGRDNNGRRVMGLVESKAFATGVLADSDFLWEVPESWSMEEAATVPCVYATVYYGLIVRGKMQPGDSILIHAGSGGVGWSAISVALSMGCEIFTTVGTAEKRQFLLKRFPSLKPENIGNSRNTSFEQLVLRRTGGRGVDIVLNSLADHMLQASVRCLGNDGRFIEIGKMDLINNTKLGMDVFLKNILFHGVLLDAITSTAFNVEHRKEVMRLVKEGLKNGAVQPLPCTVFKNTQVEEAFRYMASGRHIGKVILKIRDEETEKTIVPQPMTIAAAPRIYFHPEKSYIITGGLGGFGLALASYLAKRGAKNLILTSRSGIKTGYQVKNVQCLRDLGVQVVIATDDATTAVGAEALLQSAIQIAPVGGIFNLAAVLRDKKMSNQTINSFITVCKPKVHATRNLDVLSRSLCPQLDHFVAFSSISCGRGNVGQCNYGWANSVMERICEQRQILGLPGLAIQWGAIGDVGMLIDLIGHSDIAIGGTLPQKILSCLQTLDLLLVQPYPVVASMVVAEKEKKSTSKAKPNLLDAILKILGYKNSKSINPKSALSDMGLDSLMGTEIKQMLERNYDLLLTPAEVRGLTVEKLRNMSGKTGEVEPTTSRDQKISLDEFVLLLRAEAIVQMDSKGKDEDKTPIFMIHPIEGTVENLRATASHLTRPVFGLQCAKQVPTTSLNDMANFYERKIRSIQPVGPYLISGYSHGAVIAFEVTRLLEDAGEKVNVIFIDGSPGYMKAYIMSNDTKEIDEENIDAEFLHYFVHVYTAVYDAKLREKLIALPTHEERLEATASVIGGSLARTDLIEILEGYYRRLLAAYTYVPSRKIAADVTLIKSEHNFVQIIGDYGLSEICEKPIKLHTVKGSHRGMVQGEGALQIAEIIISTTEADNF